MIGVLIYGYNGKMGKVVRSLIDNDSDMQIVAGVDYNRTDEPFPTFQKIEDCNVKADVVIDFSTATAIPALLDWVGKTKTPVVLCTTGLEDQMLLKIECISRYVAVFKSYNMSLGINLLASILKKISPLLSQAGFDIEIVERHHNQKIDAPSGTAIMLADSINNANNNKFDYVYDRSKHRQKRDKKELGIHAVRGGSIVGDHSIIFAGKDEVIELNHSAYSKEVFAVGAVNAAKFIVGKKAGIYDMQDMLRNL